MKRSVVFQVRLPHTLLFSVGIPWLSAFITFVLLGCWGDTVNRVVQVHFQLLKAGTALGELCHNPWSLVHCCRTLSCPTILRMWPRPKSKGTWEQEWGLPVLPGTWDISSVRFCSGLLEGKGPRLRRWGGWRDYPLSFSFWIDALTSSPLSSREKLYRAENKMWMAKMCMFNLKTGASCLPVAEFRASCFLLFARQAQCSVTDILDAVQSTSQNSERPCLKDAEVSLSPF